MKLSKKILLIILDGWGLGNYDKPNAIYSAKTLFFDSLITKYPNSKLHASEKYVGLPDKQMGNSEVGHMALGAGRIIYQNIVRIDNDISSDRLKDNSTLKETLLKAQQKNSALHFMGLVSDGGIHSHINHLKALLKTAASYDLTKVYVHAFTDGRDTDPHSALKYLQDLESYMKHTCGSIATISGRYYAMDRDRRIDRTMKAFDVIFNNKGLIFDNINDAILKSYEKGITDEFIIPTIIKHPIKVNPKDVFVCFNFRTDRCRQISEKILELRPKISYVTMTNYDKQFKNVAVLYDNQDIKMTLGEVLSKYNLKQLRIAETEKYPHVTFFFSGGKENAFTNEDRILIPSPKVATYDLAPEMSAYEITKSLLSVLSSKDYDFICLNFANADMVGHTGNYNAVTKAIETVDKCLSQIVPKALNSKYSIIILADHGNADYMINSDDSPNTAHTLNMVPLILIDEDYKKIKKGKLGDVAPTILKLLNLPIPKEMNGDILI